MTDAVTPEKGLLPQDLINFVGDLYHFAVRPNMPPQALFSGVIPLTFGKSREWVS
jgi:hypothetical protein